MNGLTAIHSLVTLTLGLACLYLLRVRGTPHRKSPFVAAPECASEDEPTGPSTAAAHDVKSQSHLAAEPEDAPRLMQFRPQTSWFEMERLRRRDPQYRAVHVESMKWSTLWNAPQLIARVGYTQAEQIASLWSESSYSAEPFPEPGIGLTEMQHMQQQRARDAALVQRVAETLGGEVAGEFARFLQQRPATLEVDQLRTALAGSQEALRDDQVDNLLTSLSQARWDLQRQIAEEEEFAAAINPVEKASAPTLAGRLHRIARAQREAVKLREAAAGYLSEEQMKQYYRLLQRNVRLEQLQFEQDKVAAGIDSARAQPRLAEKQG